MMQNIITGIIISISVILTVKWFSKFIKSSKKINISSGCEPEACGSCSHKTDKSCESEMAVKIND